MEAVRKSSGRLMVNRYAAVALMGVSMMAGGCSDAADPTLAAPREQPMVMSVSARREQAQATAEQFARTLAVALKEPGMRGVLHQAMKESRFNEHKLVLQSFLQTPAGGRMVRAMAEAGGVDEAAVLGWAAQLPEMDFYVPFPEHRRTWTGSSEVVVASNIDVDDPRFTAYRVDGSSKRLNSREGTPAETVVFLHPAEPKWTVAPPARARKEFATLDDPSGGVSTMSSMEPSGIEPNMSTSPVATYAGQLHLFANYESDGVGGIELVVKHYAGKGGTRIDEQVMDEGSTLTWDGFYYDDYTQPDRTMNFAQYGETWIKVWERDSGAESWVGGDDFWGEGAFGGFGIKHRFSTSSTVQHMQYPSQCFYYDPTCPPATVDIVYRALSQTPTGAGAFTSGDLANFTIYNTPGAWSINNGHLVASNAARQSVAVRAGVVMGDGWVETETSRMADGGLALRVQNASNYYFLAIRDDGHYGHANLEIYRVQSGVQTRLGTVADISFPVGTKKRFRFEATGTTLKAYVDGSVVRQVTDATFSSGGLGVRANNSTSLDLQSWFSVLRWTAVNPTDNFNDASSLNNYSIFGTPEAWSVQNGHLYANSDARQSIVVRNGVNFADGWVETSTDQAGDGGLILRAQDGDSYYSAAIRDDSRYGYANIEIYKVVNGTHTPLTGQIDISFSVGSAKTVRFEAIGTTLKVYVGGSLVTQASDGKYSSGFVGMRANNSTGGTLITRYNLFRFNQQ